METKTDFNLEMIGQSCESFVLDYIPYGLYHVEISPHQINGSYEVIITNKHLFYVVYPM